MIDAKDKVLRVHTIGAVLSFCCGSCQQHQERDVFDVKQVYPDVYEIPCKFCLVPNDVDIR